MAISRIRQSVKSASRFLSDESLTKKAYLNALAAGLDYAARLTAGFLVAPQMVAGLGDYLYGAWQILGRLGGYVSAASGRPSQALKWTIAYEQASTDYDAKRRSVGSALAVWALFLPFLALAGGLLAWFAPSLLKAPTAFSGQVRLATGLLAANLVLFSLAEVPQSVLRGENLGYKRMGLSAVLVLVGGGLTILALSLGTSIVGVAAVNVVNTLLAGTFFLQVVRSTVPWFGVARPAWGSISRFLRLSWWFLVWRLVNQLMMASDIVVLGMLDSVEKVTAYSLIKYAPETLVSLMDIVVGGVTPGLGGIIGSGDLPKAAQIRGEIMSLTWLMATASGATMILWNADFVRLWIGQEYGIGSIASVLIVLMVTQLVLIRNDSFVLDLTLSLRGKVLLGALSAAVSLVLAGIFVSPANLGIAGLCLGFIIGRSILSLGYPWLVGRLIGIRPATQVAGMLRPAVLTGLVFAAASRLGGLFVTETWLGLILSVASTLTVTFCLAFFVGLSHVQRRRILRRVRAVTGSALPGW